jgi:hypothetical protein
MARADDIQVCFIDAENPSFPIVPHPYQTYTVIRTEVVRDRPWGDGDDEGDRDGYTMYHYVKWGR